MLMPALMSNEANTKKERNDEECESRKAAKTVELATESREAQMMQRWH